MSAPSKSTLFKTGLSNSQALDCQLLSLADLLEKSNTPGIMKELSRRKIFA